MSLLLEALKKAELAKHGAPKAAAEAAPPVIERSFSLEIEPEPTALVMRREDLPDISQPLEILSEDLPSARRAEPESGFAAPAAAAPTPGPTRAPTLALTPAPAREPAPAVANAPPEAEPFSSQADPAIGAEREAARQLFEAKEVDYDPKRPFYIAMGIMGIVAAGYGGYVWWQMQPHYAYSAAAVQNAAKAGPPPAAQPGAPASSAAAPGATVSPPAQPSQTEASAAPATPAAPAAKTAIAPEAPPTAPSGPVLRRTGSAPAAPPQAALSSGAPATAAGTPRAGARATRAPIAITPPSLVVDPALESAWEAFQRGDFASAREAWQQVLKRESNNRDALLGLAAVEVRARDFDAADARYQRLLELDPRDSLALAGLISLRGQIDPVQAESRIKSVLANQPEATHLYFTLGNQYAAQSRWAEAQQAYFKAYSADPENADFAFNLAISLDQLHQHRPALEYYQRALALADKRPAGFDRSQAAARAQALQRP